MNSRIPALHFSLKADVASTMRTRLLEACTAEATLIESLASIAERSHANTPPRRKFGFPVFISRISACGHGFSYAYYRVIIKTIVVENVANFLDNHGNSFERNATEGALLAALNSGC
jgi:hypothetical protein